MEKTNKASIKRLLFQQVQLSVNHLTNFSTVDAEFSAKNKAKC
jgi:hypothetical protein